MPELTCSSLLKLIQLADSALPIGSLSHSFGLESLVFDGDVCPESLYGYLEDSLSESLLIDAVFCREAHTGADLSDMNQQLSALRLARETRDASLAMGRRFAALAAALEPNPALAALAQIRELHHSVAFGYTFGILGIAPDSTVSAFLHQCVLNAISAAQRLLPLGQTQANRIAWQLKPAIMEAVVQTRTLSFAAVRSFAHLPETACMRHPCLPTRLFIS
jgi:urease accessory protein